MLLCYLRLRTVFLTKGNLYSPLKKFTKKETQDR